MWWNRVAEKVLWNNKSGNVNNIKRNNCVPWYREGREEELEEGRSSDCPYEGSIPSYLSDSQNRAIRFANVVVARSVDSISLPAAGVHHGNVSTGRLIPLKLGARSGASQK
jgi:hypothetical protein